MQDKKRQFFIGLLAFEIQRDWFFYRRLKYTPPYPFCETGTAFLLRFLADCTDSRVV